jgi:hypothetical protein
MLPDFKNQVRPAEIVGAADNLADITRKWGKIDYSDPTKIIFHPSFVGAEGDWTIKVSSDLQVQTVMVKKGWGNTETMSLEGNSFSSLPLARRSVIANSPSGLLIPTDMEESAFIVDKSIDPDTFNNELAAVDMKALTLGLIKAGQRQNIFEKSYYIAQKRKTEQVFQQKGMLLVVPNGKFQQELDTFEHPEDLMIWTDPVTNTPMGIIKVSEVEYHTKRTEVTNRVLEKYNLTPEMVIEGMEKSPEVFVHIMKTIRAEVDIEMSNIN